MKRFHFGMSHALDATETTSLSNHLGRMLLCAGLILTASACASAERDVRRPKVSRTGGRDHVKALVARMNESGVPCELVLVRPGPERGERDPSLLRQDPQSPPPTVVGFCELPGAPKLDGQPFASQIHVFDDQSHLEHLADADFLAGHALVYGDRWEIFAIPARFGSGIREALGGRLIMPTTPFPDIESGSS